jgi:signal transduction histidine kinase
MRLVGRRLSVQQISIAGVALLTLTTSVAVFGLVWSSNLLQQTSAALVQAAEDLRLARDIDQQLFSHQRLAILADATSGEILDREQTIIDSIRAAQRQEEDGVQAELLAALSAQTTAYFAIHAAYRQRGDALSALAAARPTFNRAVDTVQELARYSERELARGNATAQGLANLFRLSAVVAAVLGLAVVLLIIFAVSRVVLRPILEIRETLVRFRGGDYDVQANEDIPRELGEIAGAFNDMKAELARRRDERVAFLGGVAHDLRNPLSALKAGVTALQIDRQDPAQERHILRILGRQLDQLERMCGDLLELSRMETGKLALSMEAFDLRDAAVAVTDLYRPIAGSREIAVELESEPVVVTADRLRVEQVIGNLLKNAINYSGDGQRVKVGISHCGDAAEISVSDNGVGIPENELETIFRPFRHGSATPPKGTGLGLPVVQRIVDAHGGSIQVHSELGVGSTFRVRLPSVPT